MEWNDEQYRHAKRTQVHNRQVFQAAVAFVIGCLVATSVFLFVRQNQAVDTIADLADSSQVKEQAIDSLCVDRPADPSCKRAEGEPSAEKIVEEAPVQIPVEGKQGKQGDRGPVGPSVPAAEIAQAVRAHCVDIGGCAGKDGNNATPAQIATALSRYCNDRGECAGPPGDSVKGDKGDPGESVKGDQGDVGPQGPPPSDEQIKAAVDAHCAARGGCLGKDGADGKPGPACPDDYTGQETTILTGDGPRDAFLCTADE